MKHVLRVSAALMALYPISALLSFTVGIHFALSTIISLAVNLYGLYMLYLAIIEALKGEEKTVKIVAYVLGGLLILLVIIGLVSSLLFRSISGYSQSKAEDMMQDYQKMAEKNSGRLPESRRGNSKLLKKVALMKNRKLTQQKR